MRYGVVIESAGGNLSAFVPDLPGVAVTAASAVELLSELRVAVRWHLEGIVEDGGTIPFPSPAGPTFVDVDVHDLHPLSISFPLLQHGVSGRVTHSQALVVTVAREIVFVGESPRQARNQFAGQIFDLTLRSA